ncbi:acyl-CoA synthetase [Microbacterium sp. G2-8]|uniref:acyl-CoA synthetase n=1 Tax=Microbacterium sp. G2-8 TaxID=2842454 RepID=UPI001C8AE343|nr:acyl-CoA synthetase [Microbacterium sp. G2-8]
MPPLFATPRAARTVLILRAAITAVAALVVTFVQERTATFGLTVLQMFALATAVLFFVDAVLVRERRAAAVSRVLGVIHLLAGALCQLVPADPAVAFHWILIGWAVAAGAVELTAGIAGRRAQPTPESRDRIAVGALTLLLAAVSFVVSPQYALDYVIEEAGREFTLTGTIIGVGLFGGWAAIVAVYLGIGALSPAPEKTTLTKDAK